MASYTRQEARAWARTSLTGVVNVIIPTFTSDLLDVNEAATRFDTERDIELGFAGALMVAETATTPDEYIRCLEWAADEAAGRLQLYFHASFNTLDQNVALAKRAEAAGAEVVLLSYPPNFFPASEQEIYDYTKAFCDRTDLAVMLFPVPLWGFERLHPASMSIELLSRLVEDLPTVVAVKAEGGYPSLGGFAEVWRHLGDEIVVSMPLENQAIPLATVLPLQLIATSNTECLGDAVPTMLDLCHQDRADEAMEIFWKVDPARRANAAIGAIGGNNTVHRMAWKYQAWLTGFNGGPLRQPTPRLVSSQMSGLRAGAERSGILVDPDLPDSAFFAGRNPA